MHALLELLEQQDPSRKGGRYSCYPVCKNSIMLEGRRQSLLE